MGLATGADLGLAWRLGLTIFAVMQAGLYPLFHLGRPWFFYWLIPYPSTMGVWPQFRSPLI